MASELGLDENVLRNSMPEHEENSNNEFNQKENTPRWGPQHAGAKELASHTQPVRELFVDTVTIDSWSVMFVVHDLCN
ncbi:hypothetical protein DPMN_179840 [Dreissena polymorpha]|uniref:Uncharacterized protein n=1 Tax=Dreissena polymorpha TaxID=45954 RepID=A0A9D4IMJ6_DREPO|nr:hypothetical protein DPMN_179840 [Dreissena polymorpha]